MGVIMCNKIQALNQIKKKNIGRHLIGEPSHCYIIAEIGSNFNGSLELAKKSIKSAAACGADAVKFQTFKSEEFVANNELTYSYTSYDGTVHTETQKEMFKRLELPDEWHEILFKYALECSVDFLSSAADRSAVDLLVDLKVPAIKFASEDLINISLLEYAADKCIPIILSTGMADESEIENAVDIFKSKNTKDIILFHCTSSYPTPTESCNLSRICALRNKFELPVGFSDHTEGWEAAAFSIMLGACMVEKHFTIDKTLPGPDQAFSMEPEDFKIMVDKIWLAEKMLGSGEIRYDDIEEQGRTEFRRSIVVNRKILKNEIIKEEYLSFKRPGSGLKPYEKGQVIGKKALRDIDIDQNITLVDVE